MNDRHATQGVTEQWRLEIEDDNKSAAAAGLVKYTHAEFPESENSRVPQILNQIIDNACETWQNHQTVSTAAILEPVKIYPEHLSGIS
mgnify:CR=1 FL=1